MMLQPWQKLSETYAYKGWRDLIQRKFRMPNGQEANFDIFGNTNYVSIAAFTENHEFVLVKQFRPGPEKMLVSFPEGYIDPAESPEMAGARELTEETGYVAEKLVFLKEIRRAYATSHQYCLLATGCRKLEEQQLDQEEYIEVITVSPSELMGWITNPQDLAFSTSSCAFLALHALGYLIANQPG